LVLGLLVDCRCRAVSNRAPNRDVQRRDLGPDLPPGAEPRPYPLMPANLPKTPT
jgi:hypothetical protein